MLTRAQAIDIVNAEREYQDFNYQPDKVLSSGVTRQQRDLDVTSHITLLHAYVLKAQDEWVSMKSGDDIGALQQIGKIAAIAVRALERAGNSERLLVEGLR